jgi:hypothetical protein
MTGSSARRWLLALLALVAAAVAALAVPAPAHAAPALSGARPALAPSPPVGVALRRAPNDPPDVHGLNVADTRKVLVAWNKGVVIIFDPDLRQLPRGATEANVVAVRDTLLTQSPQQQSAVGGPRVLVTLGAIMPDLTGLDEPHARAALADRGLTLDATPARPQPEWVVIGQAYPPGTLIEFRVPVPAAFGPPAAPPLPPPPPRPWLPVSLPIAIAIAAGVLLLLVLVTALVVRGVRRGRRARRSQDRDRDRQQRPPEHIEVHAFAGQVTGPDVFDLPGAPPVAPAAPPTREVRS